MKVQETPNDRLKSKYVGVPTPGKGTTDNHFPVTVVDTEERPGTHTREIEVSVVPVRFRKSTKLRETGGVDGGRFLLRRKFFLH